MFAAESVPGKQDPLPENFSFSFEIFSTFFVLLLSFHIPLKRLPVLLEAFIRNRKT